MISPQEVLEKKFKTVVLGGYETVAVDAFMEILTEDYTALHQEMVVLRKENAVLKSKLKVVAEKLEEYRVVDADMRQTLLAAKKMAAETVGEAQKQRDEILARERAEAILREEQNKDQLALEARRLDAARKQTHLFVDSLRELYARQMELLAAIPAMEMPEPKSSLRDRETKAAAEEIEKSILERVSSPPEPYGTESAEPDRRPVSVQLEAPDEDDEPEDVTQRTMSIPQILRDRFFELGSDHLDEPTDGFPAARDPDDTEVPAPRAEPPSDINQFFGHTNEQR